MLVKRELPWRPRIVVHYGDWVLTGYLAAPGFLKELCAELGAHQSVYDDLVIVNGPVQPTVWARNVWQDVRKIEFKSIGEATRQLRALGLRWNYHEYQHPTQSNHRRAALISEGLVSPKFAPLRFSQDVMPSKALGSWAMISEGEILASSKCSATTPDGDITFVEDKALPPTRAYLKLWEAFTRIGAAPLKGSHCIDLGSCPGGWSWVLATLGSHVTSVDKAPLDPEIAKMPLINFLKTSAFGLSPKDFSKMDWVFSDVICQPEKLLDLVLAWMKVFPDANYVCTIKLMGETDHEVVQKFQQIPNSKVVHLTHNKHELTWIRMGSQS